jgi:Holliday junction resolvase RusA-like endonuclease
MNETLCQRFVVLGVPHAQARPRFRHVKTHDGREFNMTYDDKQSKQYKDNTAAQIVRQNPKLIERDVPIRLTLDIYLPRPQAHFRTNGELKPNAPAWCTKKPDRDNVEKAIKDSVKGIVWYDDSQVCDGVTRKMYGDQPRVEIIVEAILEKPTQTQAPLLFGVIS